MRPGLFLAISNTSRALTDRPPHGDLAVSRSDSAPSLRDDPYDQGEIGPSGPARGGDAPPPPTHFFHFRPLQKSRVLPPHASSTVAPASVPTGLTGARPRSAAIRCAVRHDSALRAESLASALILST